MQDHKLKYFHMIFHLINIIKIKIINTDCFVKTVRVIFSINLWIFLKVPNLLR